MAVCTVMCPVRTACALYKKYSASIFGIAQARWGLHDEYILVINPETVNSSNLPDVHFLLVAFALLSVCQCIKIIDCFCVWCRFVGRFMSRRERLEKLGTTPQQFTNIYIKNFPDEVDSDEKLEAMFSEFGKIVSAKVMTDNSGKSRGFGFCSFELPADAEKVGFNENAWISSVLYCRGRKFRRSIISSNSKEKEFVRLKISSMGHKSV